MNAEMPLTAGRDTPTPAEFAADVVDGANGHTGIDNWLLAAVVEDSVVNDPELVALCDAAHKAAEARTHRRELLGDDPHITETAHARDCLVRVADIRAPEVAAEACADLLVNGEVWIEQNIAGADGLRDAKDAAREWLQLNLRAACRADVLDEVRWGESA